MNDRPYPGWMNRNWRWLVPMACLVAVLGTGVYRMVVIASHALSVTGLYQQSLAQASHDPNVIAALGQPITSGLRHFTAQGSESSRTIQGRRMTYRVSGSAALTIELTGPKDIATLHIRATQGSGRWNYQQLSVDTGHQQHIDLLQDMAAHAGKHT